MQSRKFSTRCKAKVPAPDVRRYFAGLPAVICGAGGQRIGQQPSAGSATPILWETNGTGGGKFADAKPVAAAIAAQWPIGHLRKAKPYVVCTGGEPLLQLDESLIATLRQRGFEVAVETNGTLPAPFGLDWLCVSPKAKASLQTNPG